jgi:hypothetical protein
LNTLKIRGRSTKSVMQASMRTTRRTWCCKLRDSPCLLSLNAITSSRVGQQQQHEQACQGGIATFHFECVKCVLALLWSLLVRKEIDMIEVEQRDLIKWYNNDQHIKQIIDLYKHMVSYNEVWDKITVPFNQLCQFCGGLTTMFPNTTLIELDFSILKWEKDNNRSSMTDLTLEGIFQCKQMNQIPIL